MQGEGHDAVNVHAGDDGGSHRTLCAGGSGIAGIALVAFFALVALHAGDHGHAVLILYCAVGELHPAPLGEGLSVRADNQVAGRTGCLPDLAVRADLQHPVRVQPDVLEPGLVLRQQNRRFHTQIFQLRDQSLVHVGLKGLAALVELVF